MFIVRLRVWVAFLVMGLLLPSVSGCAWYQGLEVRYSDRESSFGKRSVRTQDPYVEKFYRLQERIEKLEKKLHKQPIQKANSAKQPATTFYAINKRAEEAIAYIKAKTQTAIGKIDALIERIDNKNHTDTVTPSAQLAVANGDVSGVLERDNQGKVVGSTTDGNRYNYSVVYVYPETQPWFDMWELLNEAGVNDKWRGENKRKHTYFIYVGAYYAEKPAEKRKHSLLQLTGKAPEVRIREGYRAVAMK